MFDSNPPVWRSDAKWIIAILAVLALATAVPLVSLAQLSAREQAVPILERLLRLTLLPPGSDEGLVGSVREQVELAAGERLELLPGTEVYADPAELAELDAESAVERIAEALSERVIVEGADTTAARLAGSPLERQLAQSLEGPATELVRASLVSHMMPAGLDNGSRMANWRLQAQQSPGEEVQPIVGVFVTVPPDELDQLSVREIGERVVVGLADTLLAEGIDSARELVSNATLLQRLEEAAAGPAADRLLSLYRALLLPWESSVAERLEQGRSVLQAREEGTPALSLGVVTPAELTGLSAEEADSLVLGRLAERAYRGGGAALVGAVTAAEQAQRLSAASRPIDAFGARAHREYRKLAWLFGGVAALLLLALTLLSRGWGRLANPGMALVLAAAGGALLSLRLSELAAAPAAAEPPTSARAQGVLGYLLQLLGYVGASLPESVSALVVRNHLAMLAVGAALLVATLLLMLARRLRPRRRSLI